MFYSNNPTGPVFTNAPSGAQKKQIFVDYWNNGGAWAGQHSATDFEKQQQLDVVPTTTSTAAGSSTTTMPLTPGTVNCKRTRSTIPS